MSWLISSSVTGDKGGSDIGEEGPGKDARGTSRADSESGGEDKGAPKRALVVIPVDGSFSAGVLSGGEKRRLGNFAGDLSGPAVDSEGRRRCFSPGCHLRTPPLALALARRARETAVRPMVPSPSRGLTRVDPVPVL